MVPPLRGAARLRRVPRMPRSGNNIAFTDHSVSSDRDAVADCFRPEAVEDILKVNRELL
jgi:hypothetical protein